MKRVTVVTGSRADWGLLEPLVLELVKRFHVDIVVTGSHLSKQFGETWKDIDKRLWPHVILTPTLLDCDLPIGVSKSMGLVLFSLPDTYANLRPDLVVVLGDRYEILSAAIVAYNSGIAVAHIQNSDVTRGSLDDGYRKCIEKLASYHFPVEEYGSLGAVIPEPLPDTSDIPCKAIVIYHPYKGPWKDELDEIITVMQRYPDTIFIKSNADAGGREINRMLDRKDLRVFTSLKRPVFLSLLKRADFIIGNSSCGLIEAPSVKTPTINVGRRQDGRKRAKSVVQAEGNVRSIEDAMELVLTKKWTDEDFDNPYQKKDTVKLIADKIEKILW